MILGGTTAILTTGIVGLYAYTFKHTTGLGPRFLPHHVLFIGTAFLLFAGLGIHDMLLRLNGPVTYRLPVWMLAFTLANVAQGMMFGICRANLRHRRN